MICKFIKQKQKQRRTFKWCERKNKEITWEDCKKCSKFQPREYLKQNKPIKKKSNKLIALERKRDKGKTKKGICEICKRYSERLDPHEIYGGSNRQRSIKNNFVVYICPICHKDEEKIMQLRKEKEIEFEKEFTKEQFIELIGKSYLD